MSTNGVRERRRKEYIKHESEMIAYFRRNPGNRT